MADGSPNIFRGLLVVMRFWSPRFDLLHCLLQDTSIGCHQSGSRTARSHVDAHKVRFGCLGHFASVPVTDASNHLGGQINVIYLIKNRGMQKTETVVVERRRRTDKQQPDTRMPRSPQSSGKLTSSTGFVQISRLIRV